MPSNANPRLVLFSRYPEPGKAKTRMIPTLGPDGAAALHKKLAERTLTTLRKTDLPIELRYTGAPESRFRQWLGDDIAYAEQGEGDLGDRMARASQPAPVIFLGSDCPDLHPRHIAEAAQALISSNVVIGPAEDGGYWLLGLAKRFDYLFEVMPWGTDQILPITLSRLAARGIAPAMLETLADCDRPEDLTRWPELTA